MMTPQSEISMGNSIATKLLRYVFSLYLVIAIAVTVGHMVMEYQYQKKNISNDLRDIQKTFEKALAIELWQLNQESLRSTVEGVLEIPVISGVKIKNVNGIDVAVGGIIAQNGEVGNVGLHIDLMSLNETDLAVHEDEKYTLEVIEHTFPIVYTYENETRQLGMVTIYSNSSVIFRRVRLEFMLLVINAIIKTVALWFIFLWISNYLLRKPLTSLATATENVSLDNLESFRVKIKTSGRNELKVLEESFNSMIDNLHQSIVKRDEAEEALRKSEARFRAAFESSHDCILIWDKEYKYLYANQVAIDHVGTTREKVIGMNIKDGLGHIPDFMNLWMSRIDQVFQSKESFCFQDETVMRGQLYYTESVITPICNPDGTVSAVCVVYRDVTERIRAEKEQERLIEELESKNAELERYTYTVSHDLRTPLVTINGFVGALQEDALNGKTAQMEEDVNHIKTAIKIMATLLDDLLELSKVGRVLKPSQDTSLFDLTTEVLGLTSLLIKEKDIEVNLSPELPVVFGDRQRLGEVMQNLIENAIKYMSDRPDRRIDIGVRQEGAESVIFVRDNGIGIKPDYFENIFGLFNQLDQARDGTGVGLAIVKRIIELHGGRIWVESEGEGKGSTFCFTLPRDDGAKSQAD